MGHGLKVVTGDIVSKSTKVRAGSGKKLTVSSSNTSTKEAAFNLWGNSSRPVVAELGDDAGWHFTAKEIQITASLLLLTGRYHHLTMATLIHVMSGILDLVVRHPINQQITGQHGRIRLHLVARIRDNCSGYRLKFCR